MVGEHEPSAIVSVYAGSEAELIELQEVLESVTTEPVTVSPELDTSDFHFDPAFTALVGEGLWKLLTIIGPSIAAPVAKALVEWAVKAVKQHKPADPPIVVKVRGETLKFSSNTDPEVIRATIEEALNG